MTQCKPELCRFVIIDAGHDLEPFQHTPYAHTEDGASLWADGESEEQMIALIDCLTQMMARRREVQLASPVPGSSEHLRYETLQQEIAWLCK